MDDNKVFQTNEKVRLKHTLINCIVTDKLDCSNPIYYVLLDGKIYKKETSDLSYNIWKTFKINFNIVCEFVQKQYFIFFGTNEKDIKYSYLKIFVGICIGLLFKIIFKK